MKRLHEEPEAGEEAPSKSQVKRELKALQGLGERLAALPLATCRKLPLGARTLDALAELARIRSHGARRRQLRFLGKLLRAEDAEAIDRSLAALQAPDQAQVRLEKACERWRERLLDADGGSVAQSDFIERYPHVERSHLRQLVRNAIAERQAGKPPTVQRKLFRYLREVISASDTAP